MVTQTEIRAYEEETPRAAEGADERPERCDRLRRRQTPRCPSPSHLVTELRRAYEEATGTCLGCE
jgi:hypothetical protein